MSDFTNSAEVKLQSREMALLSVGMIALNILLTEEDSPNYRPEEEDQLHTRLASAIRNVMGAFQTKEIEGLLNHAREIAFRLSTRALEVEAVAASTPEPAAQPGNPVEIVLLQANEREFAFLSASAQLNYSTQFADSLLDVIPVARRAQQAATLLSPSEHIVLASRIRRLGEAKGWVVG